jgi:antitoxin VapB
MVDFYLEYGGILPLSLNVKSEEAHRLARARRNGGLAFRLLKIGKECACHLKEPSRSGDHGDLLYDEKGMPR